MSKDRQIISELRNYFTENGCGLGIQRIMNVLGTINITEKQLAYEKKPNCKFTCAQIVQMMVLFPFFSIKNAANYFGSSLFYITFFNMLQQRALHLAYPRPSACVQFSS